MDLLHLQLCAYPTIYGKILIHTPQTIDISLTEVQPDQTKNFTFDPTSDPTTNPETHPKTKPETLPRTNPRQLKPLDKFLTGSMLFRL